MCPVHHAGHLILTACLCVQFIMQDISWSETPYLEAVERDEHVVKELRETMRDAVKSSLIPLKAYARKYEQFLPVVHIDVREYVR